MDNLPAIRNSISKRIQRPHVRRYESGKAVPINKGLKKVKPITWPRRSNREISKKPDNLVAMRPRPPEEFKDIALENEYQAYLKEVPGDIIGWIEDSLFGFGTGIASLTACPLCGHVAGNQIVVKKHLDMEMPGMPVTGAVCKDCYKNTLRKGIACMEAVQTKGQPQLTGRFFIVREESIIGNKADITKKIRMILLSPDVFRKYAEHAGIVMD